MTSQQAIEEYWTLCRKSVPGLPGTPPQAWAFGATPEHADELLGLVLSVIKTGTASSLWEYESSGDPLPRVGDFGIILDGRGCPRALIETTFVEIVPFSEVTEEHASSEGEGDRTLTMWRERQGRFWREHSESPRGFEWTMPVVCERFRLAYF